YNLAIQEFLSFLGTKASRDIGQITADDALAFRDWCISSKKLAVGTVNTHMRVVKACFNRALKPGLIQKNPAAHVEALRESGENKRRPMTLDELKRVLKTCG